MPMYDGILDQLREQLARIISGERVPLIEIGRLTDEQHAELNRLREGRSLPGAESPGIVYIGRHHVESRCAQGYVIDDLILQLAASIAADAEPVFMGKMASLRSRHARDDGHGCLVRDQAVLEMTARKPRIEVFSVIPKGDGRIPKTTKPR